MKYYVTYYIKKYKRIFTETLSYITGYREKGVALKSLKEFEYNDDD